MPENNSPFKAFTIGQLSSIGSGAMTTELDRTLHQAYLDCEDRPTLETARTVTLTMKLTPRIAKGGVELAYVDVGFEIGKTFPKKGMDVRMKPGANGLEFVPECPDNPDQRPLPFDDGGNQK